MTTQNGELLPEYRVIFLWNDNEIDRADNTTLDWMFETMRLTDKDLISRFVRDEENPDYIIVSDKCLHDFAARKVFRHYLKHNPNSVFIFFTYEVLEPDMNLFDYAFTWNPDHICGDRIGHNFPYMYDFRNGILLSNDLTREGAQLILHNNPRFCNFIYSHSSDVRDRFFYALSGYKHVDSSGRYLNNTNIEGSRTAKNWLDLSIVMKSGCKFSIAMENATYRGYTTEKIITSLQAHTVPIYWGDPAVAEYINPKAFINISDYSSFEEAIERVKEIDNNDELWLDMVTQPWQTEEQRAKTIESVSEYNRFLRSIFSQDIRQAKRVPQGTWPDNCRNNFNGVVAPVYKAVKSKILGAPRRILTKFMSRRTKNLLRKILHFKQ